MCVCVWALSLKMNCNQVLLYVCLCKSERFPLTENMEYTVQVIDADSGCENEYQIRVRFQNECTQNVFHVPNIISPTGNPSNRKFKMETKNPEEFISLSIFDRWGGLMFYTEDINNGWNGTFNNQFVASGVYVYKIDLICPLTNEKYTILGDVTVIR